MFNCDLVFTSTSAGMPSIGWAAPAVLEGGVPDTPAPAMYYPADGDEEIAAAVARIRGLLPAMSAAKAERECLEAIADYARRGGCIAADAIARGMRAVTLTREKLLAEIAGGGTSDGEFADAVRRGAAEAIDLDAIGVRSGGTYRIHFTQDGTHAGATTTVNGDLEAISRFQEETFLRGEDGAMTDRATGRKARFLQDGHKFFYFTWA